MPEDATPGDEMIPPMPEERAPFHSLPPGFLLPRTTVSDRLTYNSSDAQRLEEITILANVKEWDDFDTNVPVVWGNEKWRFRGSTGDDLTGIRDPDDTNINCARMAELKGSLKRQQRFGGEGEIYSYVRDLYERLSLAYDERKYQGWAEVFSASTTRITTLLGIGILPRADGSFPDPSNPFVDTPPDGAPTDGTAAVSAGTSEASETTGSNEGETVQLGETIQVGGDVLIYDSALRARGEIAPDASVEVKPPFHSLNVWQDGPNSSLEEPQHYSKRIKTLLRQTGCNEREMWLKKGLCQAILQALHTRSKMSSFTSLNEAVFVKIGDSHDSGEFDVLISDLYGVEYNERNVAVLHAMFMFIVMLKKSRSAHCDAQLETAKIALNMVKNSEKVRRLRQERALRGNPASAVYRREMGFPPAGPHAVPPADEVVQISRKEDKRLQIALNTGRPLTVDIGFVRRAFFPRRQKVVGSGISGLVMKMEVNGHMLAIKKWNWARREGLQLLLNEINMYLTLHATRPALLGVAVPRVIAVCLSPPQHAMLITDYVGDEVCIAEDGFYVQGQRLSSSDIQEISTTAAKNLALLAKCGLIHNDDHLNNLRVARCGADGTEWTSWWVDLGKSYFLDENSHPRDHADAISYAENWRMSG